MNTISRQLTGSQLIRSMMMFFGAFMFAFCLNSDIIHEAGHAFGGVLFGCEFESLRVNPFGTGGWVNRCPDTMTLTGKVIQGMGGQIFGVPLSIAVTLLLWRKRTPLLLPLLMSATVVCTGNLLSVLDSMPSYPNFLFDYGWALQVGVPPWILWAICIASLVFGIIFMDISIHTEPLLPSAGATWLAIGLGVGLTALLVVSNPIWFPQ